MCLQYFCTILAYLVQRRLGLLLLLTSAFKEGTHGGVQLFD
jgi:hypothetical protein